MKTEPRDYSFQILYLINFTLLTVYTWGRWGHSFIDSYQALYIFSALAKGNVLYLDVSYYFGPFAPYLHAFLFRLFGENLLWLYLIGLLNILLVSWLLFLLISSLANSKAAWTAVFIFLNIFAFNNIGWSGLFNYIRPYNYSSVYLVHFLLAASLFQIRTFRSASVSDAGAWSLMTAGVALNRPDFAVFYFPLSCAFIFWFCLKNRKAWLLPLLSYLLPFCLLTFSIYGCFAWLVGFDKLIYDNIFWIGHLPGAANIHQLSISGLSKNALLRTTIAFLLRTIALSPLLYCFGFKNRFTELSCKYYHCVIFPAVCLFHILVEAKYVFADLQIILLITFCLILKKRPKNIENTTMLFLNLISLLSLGRIFFNISIESYLFYMGIIPLAFLTAAISRALCGSSVEIERRIVFYLWCFFLLGIGKILYTNYLIYEHFNIKVETSRGTYYAKHSIVDKALAKAINLIPRINPKVKTLVTMPEGASLNFFTGAEFSLYHPTLLPHVISSYGEAQLIEDLRVNAPDMIVYLHTYGHMWGEEDLFSVNFGKEIDAWVRNNYYEFETIGPKPFVERFWDHGGITLFCRKDFKCSY